MSFVHLHLHSQYSMLESTCRLSAITDKAAAYSMPAVAVTDYGNMFGAIEFYFAAKKAGVKPIIGMEVYLAPGSRFEKNDVKSGKQPNRRLVLLAQNEQGYRNLCQLSTIGYQEGFYYRPRIDYDILPKFSEHLICLSGGLMGDIPWTYLNRGEKDAIELIKKNQEIFGDRFYLELNRTGVKGWDEINSFLISQSKELQVPVVASNDIHYMEQREQVAQEVLICIGSNKTLQDQGRYRLGSDQFYFKSPEQMRELFKDIPEACDNTLKIAEQCNIKFHLEDEEGKPIYHLPTFPTTGGVSLNEEIHRLSFEGLEVRLAQAKARGETIEGDELQRYRERLEFELSVIDNMGFNGYFLIVQDFIKWSKRNDIPVGPGRGSGAGSLVAYCLEITDLDPMPYNLIFERFLNPERVSMPDFDIDFCQENRGRVIDYVTQKYGEASVSQIITYGKLQTRAAIRDVGRVMGMTYAEVDVISKLIPEKLGISLNEAIEMEPRLRELMETDPKVNTLMDLAQQVEGLVRHAGIHAAGVIIADGRIVDHAPLYRGVDGENVVQYDMKHAEKIGLIKFDFLGLKTLTHIQDAFRLIDKNRGKKIKFSDISLKDPGIYEIMCKGDTDGIFQFESDGITDLIKKAQPTCFEDIVAINALYRPGPMDMIPEYLRRKNGEVKAQYLFAELEPLLKETHGIVVYQEQVQLVAAKIANYSLGEADMLRRAMGKKIAEEMAQQKTRFLQGAKKNNFDEGRAEELFDTMAEFAKYGFNKSHAAAYCVVAAYTAFLKNYYPVEFFAALLSTEMSDTDKVVKYVKNAQRRGLQVNPPHVNHSEYKFTVRGEDIYFSLGAIKGVGQSAVEAIVEARESLPEKKFESLEHFFSVVDLRRVNKKTVECLIKAGGFDGFGANRAELMQGYGKFIERADKAKKDQELGQASLFAMDEEIQQEDRVQLESVAPWLRSKRLSYEKEVLGFYLSDHPLKGMEHLIVFWTSSNVQNLSQVEHKKAVRVAGLIASFREIITKKGTRMAFAQLEDLTGQIELVIFPNTYAECEMTLKSEQPLLVHGTLENAEDSQKIIVEKIQALDDLMRGAKKVTLEVTPEMQTKMQEVRELFERFPGDTTVHLAMQIPELKKCVELDVLAPKGIEASAGLIEGIHTIFGGTEHFSIN